MNSLYYMIDPVKKKIFSLGRRGVWLVNHCERISVLRVLPIPTLKKMRITPTQALHTKVFRVNKNAFSEAWLDYIKKNKSTRSVSKGSVFFQILEWLEGHSGKTFFVPAGILDLSVLRKKEWEITIK